MYGPLKATSLLGRQTGSLCIGISSPLLCTELGEMRCIQSRRRIPPPRRLFSLHKQAFNQREKRLGKSKICPFLSDPKHFGFSHSDHHHCSQKFVCWGQKLANLPSLSFCYFLPSNFSALEFILRSFCGLLTQYDWSSHHLTTSTIHSKYLSTH